MGTGIAVMGLNGSGKSALSHALAKKTGFYEMDIEDYYFPEQSASRQMRLENLFVSCNYLGKLPFSEPRTKAEVQQRILYDIKEHPDFILSGVSMNWCEEITSQLSIAFIVRTPVEERVKRVQLREEARFGERVLEGGDMYEQQVEFRALIAERSEETVTETALKLKCPVIELDGMGMIMANVEKAINCIRSMGKSDSLKLK